MATNIVSSSKLTLEDLLVSRGQLGRGHSAQFGANIGLHIQKQQNIH